MMRLEKLFCLELFFLQLIIIVQAFFNLVDEDRMRGLAFLLILLFDFFVFFSLKALVVFVAKIRRFCGQNPSVDVPLLPA